MQFIISLQHCVIVSYYNRFHSKFIEQCEGNLEEHQNLSRHSAGTP